MEDRQTMQTSLSFEMMADDEAALLHALHIDSADVIGWSDGGIIALVLAMRHPGKVKKLVSTGANLWPDSTALVPWLWKVYAAQLRSCYKIVPQQTARIKMTEKSFCSITFNRILTWQR